MKSGFLHDTMLNLVEPLRVPLIPASDLESVGMGLFEETSFVLWSPACDKLASGFEI